jgi:SHS2 domain-containing protein
MATDRSAAPYEILEHTADIGVRARGRSLEELFENAAWGMAEVLGARAQDERGRAITVHVEGADREALLVAWLDEVMFRLEHSGGRLSNLHVRAVREGVVDADVILVEDGSPPDGTELKAATYHQLAIRQTDEGYEATVYFDV